MLIDNNGKKKGLVSIDEALKMANNESLDLVQVSPSNSDPVVCKLLDYGKHLFDKKKSTSSSKVRTKRNTTKEIKFRPSTDVVDVAPGYARNYLFPQGKAVNVTPSVLKQIEKKREKEKIAAEKVKQEAIEFKTALKTIGRFSIKKQERQV